MGQTLEGIMGQKETKVEPNSSLQEQLIKKDPLNQDTSNKNDILENDKVPPKQQSNYRCNKDITPEPQIQQEKVSEPQLISINKIAEAAEKRLLAAQNRGIKPKRAATEYVLPYQEPPLPESKEIKVEEQPIYSPETIARAAEERLQTSQNKGMSKQSQIEYQLKLAKKEEAEKYERERRGQQYSLTYK